MSETSLGTAPKTAVHELLPRLEERLAPAASARERSLELSGDERAFHDELRQRSLPILFWSACVFNTVYVAWTGFDYLLAPQHWQQFLALRLIAAGFNTVLVTLVHHPALRRYSWEAFWLWLFVMGAFISVMLTKVDASSYIPYVVGFTLVLYGSGLLPYWHPRWALSILAVLLGAIPLTQLLADSALSARELISTAFISVSSAGLSLLMAWFKYTLARSDFLTRKELSDAAQREHKARLELDSAGAALRQALEQLKELNRLKSQFFANISHELRTPLTLILAPVEELGRELPADSHQKRLRVIHRSAERLLRLIDDLLELSRLDAGGLRLNLAEVDLRGIAASIWENAQPAAAARSVSFQLHAEQSAQRIWGDAHRIEIVLTNLVSNALKYTPEGGAVEIRVQGTDKGVAVEVRDTGAGIPAEDLPHIFERFYQVLRTDRRRHQGGVGIGLALAKELVELHGGALSVRSEPGKGSSFRALFPYGKNHIRPELIERRREFRPDVPLRRRDDDAERHERESRELAPSLFPGGAGELPQAPTPEPVRMRAGRKARLVLAEDQQDLREFMRELLSRDYDVLTASDGAQAWSLVQRERPDLVISDVMMPEKSGTRLCHDIKADPALATIPVILLTAWAGSDATLHGYAQGADDFVAKPFHPQVLLARVRAQLLLRKLALDVVERERFAAIGTLAAGLLHEVRNPLNAMLNAARVLHEPSLDPATHKRLLEVVSDCAERIHDLTRTLDTHARPSDAGGATVCDVREGLEATLALLAHRCDGVVVERDYAEGALAHAPAGPVNQIFLNLVDNALNAGAKRLWLRILSLPEQIEVHIRDDGPGVPAELGDRIFDAFVSGSVNGSGLGLYLSRSIAEQHGGALRLLRGESSGSCFVVSLPKELS